nr:hypothetical protein GCM10020093_009820 [Planobispora longispora]
MGQQPGVVARGDRTQDQALRRQDVIHSRQITGRTGGQLDRRRESTYRWASRATFRHSASVAVSLSRAGNATHSRMVRSPMVTCSAIPASTSRRARSRGVSR